MKNLPYLLLGCFSLCFLNGCNNTKSPIPIDTSKPWEQQVEEISNEIDRLIKEDHERRQKANEEERQALIYMRDDWAKFSQKIQEVEKNQEESRTTEKTIKELKDLRQQIIEANKK